jgi:hypothetical protein
LYGFDIPYIGGDSADSSPTVWIMVVSTPWGTPASTLTYPPTSIWQWVFCFNPIFFIDQASPDVHVSMLYYCQTICRVQIVMKSASILHYMWSIVSKAPTLFFPEKTASPHSSNPSDCYRSANQIHLVQTGPNLGLTNILRIHQSFIQAVDTLESTRAGHAEPGL